MSGMSALTGRRLDVFAHLRQSIRDILTTPIGSRVMRRDYGSRLFSLIDAGITQDNLVQIYAAVAGALMRWEPRLRLTRVRAVSTPSDAEDGQLIFDLEGEYLLPASASEAGSPLGEYRPIHLEGLAI